MAGVPGGVGEFGLVDGDGIVAVQVAEEAHKNVAVHAPGLALVVAEVLDPQAHLLEDLPVDGLLHGLADLCVARQQGEVGVAPAGIAAQQEPVAVGDGGDDHRVDPGENQIAAFRTAEHPLAVAMDRLCAAGAAETVILIPVLQVPAR